MHRSSAPGVGGESGSTDAQDKLGSEYMLGRTVERNYIKSAFWYGKAAENGDAEAQRQLGSLYDRGWGVTQDHAHAAECFRKAADQGSVAAAFDLGNSYYDGKGIRQDYAQAALWYRKAAEQGNASAQSQLAALYYVGRGVQKDHQQAAVWWRRAAEQGDISAESNIGELYGDGDGVQQDYGTAVLWLRKAAEKGDSTAQSYLGGLYYNGSGVPQDFSQAQIWITKAAEDGDAQAQRNLGILYYYGDGVVQSAEQAEIWFRKAAEQGDSQARAYIRKAVVDNDSAQKFCGEEEKATSSPWLGTEKCESAGGGWIIEHNFAAAIYAHKSGQDEVRIVCTDNPSALTLGRRLLVVVNVNESKELFTIQDPGGSGGVRIESFNLKSVFNHRDASAFSEWKASNDSSSATSQVSLLAVDPQEELAFDISRSDSMVISGMDAQGPIEINLHLGRLESKKFDKDCESTTEWANVHLGS